MPPALNLKDLPPPDAQGTYLHFPIPFLEPQIVCKGCPHPAFDILMPLKGIICPLFDPKELDMRVDTHSLNFTCVVPHNEPFPRYWESLPVNLFFLSFLNQ